MNKKILLVLGLGVLMASCKTSRSSSSSASMYANYQENLSGSLPVYPDYQSQLDNSATNSSNGSVEAIDTQLAQIDESAIQKNRSEPYFSGFTVLVFSGIDREKAFSTQNKILSDYPDLVPEMQYHQPMYLVKVGKFAHKIEAQKAFSEVKNQFPTARIIQDRIQRQEFESTIESKNNVEGEN